MRYLGMYRLRGSEARLQGFRTCVGNFSRFAYSEDEKGFFL